MMPLIYGLLQPATHSCLPIQGTTNASMIRKEFSLNSGYKLHSNELVLDGEKNQSYLSSGIFVVFQIEIVKYPKEKCFHWGIKGLCVSPVFISPPLAV